MIEIHLGIAGHFVVDLIDGATQQVKQHLEFSNIITNAAFDLLGLGTPIGSCFQYVDVGHNNTTPKASDTKLGSSLGLRTRFSGSNGPLTTTSTTPECAKRQITRIFLESEVNGQIAELGFWTSQSNGILTNRALIKDAAGVETTILKTPSDQLRIQYEYQIFAPDDYAITSSFVVSDEDIPSTIQIRPQGVNLTNNWVRLLDDFGNWNPSAYVMPQPLLVPRTSINTFATSSLAPTSSLSSYILGSYYRDMECSWTPINTDRVHGVYTFSPWNTTPVLESQVFQMLVVPTPFQSTEQRAQIGLRISWYRV